MAATLHQRVLNNFTDYYPSAGYRRLFEALAHSGTPRQVTLRVLKLVNKLRNDH